MHKHKFEACKCGLDWVIAVLNDNRMQKEIKFKKKKSDSVCWTYTICSNRTLNGGCLLPSLPRWKRLLQSEFNRVFKAD